MTYIKSINTYVLGDVYSNISHYLNIDNVLVKMFV